MTAADAALNGAMLLEVARGDPPPRNAALKDYPVHELGPIATMDPRLRLKRLEWERENEILAQKRYTNIMTDRTAVALAVIRACSANYPEYGNQIRALCDYSSMGVPGSYYDGPRAYRLYQHHMHPVKARSKADKKLYELALKAQEAMKLPNGCQGEDFRKVGDSFIVNILPNLSRKFENTREDPDVARHIIVRLPEELKTEGRNLLANLLRDGTFTNPRHVLDECVKIVEDYAKEDVKSSWRLFLELLGW